VAPAGFQGTFVGYSIDVWVPLMMAEAFVAGPNRFADRRLEWLEAFARLRPTVSRAQAQSELDVMSARLQSEFPDVNGGLRLAVYPLWQTPFGAVPVLAPVLGVLGSLVVLVLVIACANLANLLLARGLSRSREIAIRMALGAGRWRIVRPLVVESALLAIIGGGCGVGIAIWTRDLLPRFVPPAGVQLAHLLYKVIVARHRRRSTALLTNIDFDGWADYMGDAPLAMAFLDRLVEGTIIIKIKGKS